MAKPASAARRWTGNLGDQAVQVVPQREVEVHLGLEDLDHGRTPSRPARRRVDRAAQLGEERGEDVAGPVRHGVAGELAAGHPAGLGHLGRVGREIRPARPAAVVEDDVVVVVGARGDVLEDVDQAADHDVDAHLLAHLPVERESIGSPSPILPPGITHIPRKGGTLRRVSTTRSCSSTMTATTEVTMCCFR